MLDAWVNKKDVQNLIEQMECLDGMIERSALIIGINSLKEHKRPKSKPPQKNYRINNKPSLLILIQGYKEAVNMDIRKSCFFVEYDEWQKVCYSNFDIDESNTEIIEASREFVPINQLIGLLKISKRTLGRWVKAGILDTYYSDELPFECVKLEDVIRLLLSD